MLARMLDATNTPTRLPPPPREVCGGVGARLWFMRLFILPHMCVGVGLVGMFLLTVLVVAFGTDTSAVVTEAHTGKTSKGRTSYHITYRYRIGEREHTKSDSVAVSTYAAVSDPGKIEEGVAKVRMRYIELGSLHYHLLVEGDFAWKPFSLLFAVLFWNGIVSIFVYAAWVAPIRNRWLVRHGAATVGKIVSRRMVRGKGTSYYATFTFREPASGQEFKRVMRLPGELKYEVAQEGRAVTVVYDPSKPKRSLVYELSGCRVADVEPN
jgi:hypothetical protein